MGAEVDEILSLIERGRLTVPDGVALEDFVAAGGKIPQFPPGRRTSPPAS
jgi:hypothetical protein